MLSVLSVSGAYAADVIEKSVVGNPELKSINVISFAPEGVLLIGDGAAAQIVAIETEDTSPAKALPKKLPTIQKLIAGHIGAKADGIEILDLAVNPASGRAYIAIRKQDDKSYIIVTVDGSGEVREFELDNVKYARVQLSAGKVKVSRITDVAWGDDRVIAAGRSNETFSSKIFSIDAPLEHEAKGNSFSAETYHVSHGKWETKAPMSVVIPFKENGKTYVVGAYSCTPIVKYPIDSLKPGAQVKGESVLELGSGNTAIDMFIYTKDGKPYVLANTFRFHHARKPFGPSPYWTVKFEQGILAEDANVNEKALRRLKGYEPATERVAMVEAYHGVRQMDKLGDSNALVMREGSDGLSLEVLVLP
ncbi:MAG: hypothetical protein CMJ64_01965 [Planctomycetaceae bacterium]|nr:hypothetical protein [Planctomycetaceae bacterium]